MKYLYKPWRNVFVLILFAIFLQACRKFVQIPAPDTQLVTTSVFANNSTATAAQTAIYSQMIQESFYMSQNCGLLSDELTNYSTAISQLQFYTNSMTANQNISRWSNIYNYIYQINAVLEGLSNNSNLAPNVVKQLMGEAKFLRAFWFFYLTNQFGAIPLTTSTDYSINAKLPRTSQEQVYGQIINDLKEAQSLLNSNYVSVNDTSITNPMDKVRPTKWAATALLARAYLYTKKYDLAEIQATAVIDNSQFYQLENNLNNVFLKNSMEAIWQLAIPLPSDINTPDGEYFILIGGPQSGVNNSTSISPELLNAFETGDKRLSSWIDSFTTSSTPSLTYYFPYKYKIYQSGDIQEYVMVLRLAEQYLIRAEARAMQNNLGGTAADLDTIRTRAGLPNTTASTQAEFLNAILHERQVELFTEWGHRWYDLIRTGNANSVMSVVTPLKGGVWSPNWQLFPIPQDDILIDHNLTQNNGY